MPYAIDTDELTAQFKPRFLIHDPLKPHSPADEIIITTRKEESHSVPLSDLVWLVGNEHRLQALITLSDKKFVVTARAERGQDLTEPGEYFAEMCWLDGIIRRDIVDDQINRIPSLGKHVVITFLKNAGLVRDCWMSGEERDSFGPVCQKYCVTDLCGEQYEVVV